MMGIAYLDGSRLSRGLLAGIRRVVADQEHLNRINVFPVPDGDTGTNLTLTMMAVRTALDGHHDRHAGRTLELVADAALDGARGNSGAIMAQFFHGLGDACSELRQLTPDNFADAVGRGAAYAREALSEPREGTILTVVSDFATELMRHRDDGHDFAALLQQGLTRAQVALAQTTQQLEVLRKAGVVDAGAQGFVDLLQGATELVLHGGPATEDTVGGLRETPVVEAFGAAASAFDHSYRYCTECVVTGDAVERHKLREALADIGGSLVVAGTRRKIRVHAHVDDPDQLFEIARGFGEISSQKADDMRRQTGAAGNRNTTVAVVTDSAGDWPEEAFERLGMHMVPVRVHFGDRSYLDKVSLSPESFYDKLQIDPHHPKTSQPAPGDFRRLYQFLASHHPAVISIHISARVSGTFQAAESSAARLRATDSDTPVIAIDSRSASLGQGLIAMYAAELAQSGLDVDQIVTRLDAAIARTHVFGLMGDMRYAVRGGRVPRSKKLMADLLRLDPVLTAFPDGRISVGGVLLGRSRRVTKFARYVCRRIDTAQRYRLGIGHACNPDGAARLAELLLARLPNVESHFVTELGTALGAHGGPGTLVVGLQEYPPSGHS